MSDLRRIALLFTTIALAACACDKVGNSGQAAAARSAPASASAVGAARAPAASGSASTSPKATPAPVAVTEPQVEETIEGNFRGKQQKSRVLFLDDSQMVHAWDEGGVEGREPITTAVPPGTRECKALRSVDSRDFLICVYWITGPGGGRTDGVLFDLQQRTGGEFFSAAINVQLHGTLCYPDTMVGPMPSVTLAEWTTEAATAGRDAQIVVKVEREGWTTRQAARIRAQPAARNFCKCVGDDDCPGQPSPPTAKQTIIFRLTGDKLRPTPESKPILAAISAQWGHNDALKAWNLTMRGYGSPPPPPPAAPPL